MSDLVGLDVRCELLELGRVLTGMVAAEQQFSTGGQHCPDPGGSAAPVATIGSGQFGAGKRAGHGFSLRPVQSTRPDRLEPAAVLLLQVLAGGIDPSTLTSDFSPPLFQTNADHDVFPRPWRQPSRIQLV